MAYRVAAHSARPARRGPPPSALSRNALIAGAALGCFALGAAGTALLGSGPGSPVLFAGKPRSALKVALIDPVAPEVETRDPRVALDLPADAVVAAPVQLAAVPLPRERPAQVAEISLPPERLLLASADPDITGSLGEPSRALGYAAPLDPPPRPSPARGEGEEKKPAARGAAIAGLVGGLMHPVTAASNSIDPPAADKKPSLVSRVIARLKPRTPQEKLWGDAKPVRLASLGGTDVMPRGGYDPLPRAPYDKQTAVYVISDKKVYLPDGTTFEAHSGLGDKMDDPRYVRVRMRGATPPHVYDLTLRESLFHGVEAIRMTPLGGEEAIFGRDGILAHSYMLGPNGQSNGCVSFKDYDAFLEAFKDGKITRMAVLERLD